ncbi:MAG: 50S ribosomal protein L1, partial [Armatimonadota bacterium]
MRKNSRSKQKHSNRYNEVAKLVDKTKFYEIGEAVGLVKQTANTKFVEGVSLSFRLGVDPKKGDQNVRGTTNLPHGTGRSQAVAVLAKGDLAKEALAAGADHVGDEDLIKQIQENFSALKVDVVMATTDMAPQLGKIGRILGSKTPNKKNGTVTDAIGQAVKEIKQASRVEYRVDKEGIIHMPIGKVNFTDEQIQENLLAAVDAVIRAKPSSSKGRYLQTLTLSSTMGPGIP